MRDRARDGGMGKSNEEIEREQTVEGRESAFFFNPGSSSALSC